MRSLLIVMIVFTFKLQAQPNSIVYTYLSENAKVYNEVAPMYKLHGLVDMDIWGHQLISTGISDTSIVVIDEFQLNSGVNDMYKNALVISSFNIDSKNINWSLNLPAEEIHRAKTLFVNDTLYTALAFTGNIEVDGSILHGSEEINSILLKLNLSGELLTYKIVDGLSFLDFAANNKNLFFAGWYKFDFMLDGQAYANEMGEAYENNEFYACYSKSFEKKWVRVASHLIPPHHHNPFTSNNQLKLVHANENKLYVVSFTGGIDPLVLGSDTLLAPNFNYMMGNFNLWHYNTYRLFTLNTNDGALSKLNCFYTYNNFGINFIYDESTDEIKTLVGRDSILRIHNGANSGLDYELLLDGEKVDFEDEYYLKIKFSELYRNLRFEKTGLDYDDLKLISENELCETKVYYFNQLYKDTMSYFRSKIPYRKRFSSYLFFIEKGRISSHLLTNRRPFPTFVDVLRPGAFVHTNNFTSNYSEYSDYPAVPIRSNVVYYETNDLSPACSPKQVFVPNAFSPNDDKTNDSFSIAPQDFTQIHWQIFAGNGQCVYEGSKAWDGTCNGKLAANGIYVYLFSGVDAKGLLVTKKGTVNVIR